MTSRHILNSTDQIRILADPRRLQILRRLMAQPATISQLGRIFGEHPAWIRHHLKKLEQAGLVELESTRVTGGYVEKFYKAIAPAFVLQNMILPEEPEGTPILLMGSHDLALELLAESCSPGSGQYPSPAGTCRQPGWIDRTAQRASPRSPDAIYWIQPAANTMLPSCATYSLIRTSS